MTLLLWFLFIWISVTDPVIFLFRLPMLSVKDHRDDKHRKRRSHREESEYHYGSSYYYQESSNHSGHVDKYDDNYYRNRYPKSYDQQEDHIRRRKKSKHCSPSCDTHHECKRSHHEKKSHKTRKHPEDNHKSISGNE